MAFLKILRFKLILFLALLSLAPTQRIFAALNCSTAVSPSSIRHESAIEIEMGLNEAIVDYLTTDSGTLSSLFVSAHLVPSEVSNWIYTKTSNKGSSLDFSFEALPKKLKLLALQKGIISKKIEFGTSLSGSRRITGIKVKDEYQEKYNLMPIVELGTPSSSVDAKLIELHMRAYKAPGDLARQAARFQKNLGYKPGPLHMHVVFELPKEWLAQNPIKRAWQLFDFWRRLNLTMEMRDVFENGRSIIDNYTEFNGIRFNNFAPARNQTHEAVLAYLMSVGFNANNNGKFKIYDLDRDAKMAWIGFWSHKKYDKPGLFGFELRFLDGSDLPPGLVEFLNQLPDQIKSKKFGISETDFSIWGKMIHHFDSQDNLPESLRRILKNEEFPMTNNGLADRAINPHRSYKELLNELDFDFQRILLGLDKQETEKAFESRGRLRYLIHNWSLDPVLFDKPEEAQKLRALQLRALRKWAQGQDEKGVVQEFLLESGLYRMFSDSIGYSP